MFLNANGLAGKAESVMDIMANEQIDVCLLVETWLREGASATLLRPFLDLRHASGTFSQRGRRGKNGIFGISTPEWADVVRVLEEDPGKLYGFFTIGPVVVGVGYFPPSLGNEKIEEFIGIAELYSQGGAVGVLLLGDFNARMGSFTGDHSQNPRGVWLRNRLQNSIFTIKAPDAGRYTTYAGGGRGITDLVLVAGVEIADHVVHETLEVGSDHRPITLELVQDVQRPRTFHRWNVRKLADAPVRDLYTHKLSETRAHILEELQHARDDAEPVEASWKIIREWIEAAAAASCGVFHFRTFARRDFWTPELRAQQEEVRTLAATLKAVIDSNQPIHVRQAASRRMTEKRQALAEALGDRKTEVFHAVVNDLGQRQNAGAMMRMVGCVNRRRTRSGCALDPSQMQEHAAYYVASFAGAPEGRAAEFEGTRALPSTWERRLLRFPSSSIKHHARNLALGKAAGIDGLSGEFFVYGADIMSLPLFHLFERINEQLRIPRDWTTALIVPVYKKGNKLDIRNYRPIALTCVCRRLYERVLHTFLEPAMQHLSDWQGGFRKRRSTLDQVFCLQEITTANPGLLNVFLDLQTAYDMVDRRILWSRLHHVYHLDQELIARLRMLFDSNTSILQFQNHRSAPIVNNRGLLQGSSLSPTLFNFFIDELVHRLSQPDMPKVLTHGIRTNCLFFADDGNLHAKSAEDMQSLLNVCADWSQRVGMRFSPSKCALVSSQPTSLSLYETALPQKESETYLGMPVTPEGLDWELSARNRTNKAKGVIVALSKVGFNGTGWPPWASIQVMRSFIRPVMEYGVALRAPTQAGIRPHQLVQNWALRTLFSVPRTSSTNALHKLALVEPFLDRAQVLHMRFAARLHNSTDSSIPAVRIWRAALQGQRRNSLAVRAQDNPLWRESRLANHLFEPLRRGTSAPAAPFKPQEQRHRMKQAIVNLDRGTANVGGAIQLEMHDRHRPILLAGSGLAVQDRVTIIRWLVGAVHHQPCKNCPQQPRLTRRHAVECSGVATTIQQRLPRLQDPGGRHTILDAALNCHRNTPASDAFYPFIAGCISRIFTHCLGYRQTRRGHWQNPSPPTGETQERSESSDTTSQRQRGRPRSGIG